MRQLKAALLPILVCTLLVSPTTAQDTSIDNPDESTPTTLYFHIFDTFNKFVINTQPMDAEFFEVGGNNFPTFVGTPINQVYGADFDLNTIYGYSTAGPVEYDFIENGRPRFHPERGIAADVQIDESVEPVVTLYLDVRDVMGGSTVPNYMPTFTMRVTVQEGDDPGVGAQLDAGADIMQGQTTFNLANLDANGNPYQLYCTWLINCDAEGAPAPPPTADQDVIVPGNQVVAGQTGPDGNPIYTPDEDGVVEVKIPLEILQTVIPKSEAFNVRLDWYQEFGPFGEDQFSEGFFRLVADPDHLPRLDMAITNPVYLSFIHPQVAANTLLIHAGANSPWGTYDLDIDNVEMTIEGPAKPQNLRAVLTSNEHVHGLHDADAQLTYLWDFRDEGAPDGEYTITVKVRNDAGTAEAVGSAKFVIEGEVATGFDSEGNVVEPTLDSGDVDTPGFGAIGAIALLGAALVIARRRGSA